MPSHSFPISASTVRQAIKEENFTLLKQLVPETTLQYFESEESIPVIKKNTGNKRRNPSLKIIQLNA